MPNHKKAFTLIELLVVIAIISTLATLTIASFSNAQEKARDAARKSDFEEIGKALELAKSDCLSGAFYPARSPSANFGQIKDYLEFNNYMESVPDDPKFSPGYTYNHLTTNLKSNACLEDSGSTQYSGALDYSLKTTLENQSDQDGQASWQTCNGKPGVSGTYTSGDYYTCNQ